MNFPDHFLESMNGLPGFDQITFKKVHGSGEQVTSVRLNPAKNPLTAHHLPLTNQIPWSQHGYYLPKRPSFTFDPLFHAGTYYVQEASSMFLEQAIKQSVDFSLPLKILDLCAAPGGKSTHLQSLISATSILVSNEVIRPRVNILKENIIKWGCGNVVITSNDPQDFSNLENYFDVIVVDAPCSGSGLFRRDPDAIEEWSENNVKLCSQRQQRILADIWPALKQGGILVYSTCSYSKEEDEEMITWMLDNYDCRFHNLDIPASWGIVQTDRGYRFWPDKLKGEGFFIAVLTKKSVAVDAISEKQKQKQLKLKKKPVLLNKSETAIINERVLTGNLSFIKNESKVYAWPANMATDFSFLLQELRVIYSGVQLGELMHNKLIPSHALAMSRILKTDITRIELDEISAIRYLQRKDLDLTTSVKGWAIVSFRGFSLGWANVLPNRINNYYPKEWRILKDS